MGVNDEKNIVSETAPDVSEGEVSDNVDHLHRRLNNRQIQLIAIGGSIGTALFVSIGGALGKGGPGSLFIAYLLYSIAMGMVNNCAAEMTVYMPVSGGFVRLAGQWVDDAFGFMAGWNFFFYEALIIPFEITALTTVLGFWRNDIPAAAVCAVCLGLYTLINILAVRAYGEAEFWLSGGKVFLIMILFSFTFFAMCGANPQHHAFGFSAWGEGRAFAEYIHKGDLGRFQGFLACLWSASFTVVGPEYMSMVAAEAKRPRIFIKNAYKTVYWRFGVFFIGGALFVGIVLPYNDPTLVRILSGKQGGGGTAAASPYVIAMQNMGIQVLPQITNALLVTSIFSAGNTYTYCATRTLYGLALEHRAPKIFAWCTKGGVPIPALVVAICFGALSFLQLGNSSATVLNWLIDLVTAGGVIDFIVISITYLNFYYACQAQGIDRRSLPYYGYLQPFCGWFSLVWLTLIVFCYGYTSFTPWDVGVFFSYYAMLIVAPVLFVAWKLIKRTPYKWPSKVDLVWQAPIIDAYESSFLNPPVGFWTELLQMVGLKRENLHDRRKSSVIIDRRGSLAHVKN